MDKMKELFDEYQVGNTKVENDLTKLIVKFEIFLENELIEKSKTNDISHMELYSDEKQHIKGRNFDIYKDKETDKIYFVRDSISLADDFRYIVYSIPEHTQEEYEKLLIVDEIKREENTTTNYETRLSMGMIFVPIMCVFLIVMYPSLWYVYAGIGVFFTWLYSLLLKSSKKSRIEEVKRRQEKYRNK